MLPDVAQCGQTCKQTNMHTHTNTARRRQTRRQTNKDKQTSKQTTHKPTDSYKKIDRGKQTHTVTPETQSHKFQEDRLIADTKLTDTCDRPKQIDQRIGIIGIIYELIKILIK